MRKEIKERKGKEMEAKDFGRRD
uniref:Uncharacterized protein n=1 Tax=Rhizophora mucronata TaxID=61149 RepID=A0A2P2LVX7_RHIMU